ncbi:methyl-accepting chemotaxis protein [Mycobacterium tuberculosis]|uniref:methyl-accepting chemotaxis protein n=1 Tax=Mycobacterium tuberculosis TaxID=1773 RepID=UPI00272CBEC8|nr:methyl-accepting chemotaxis protein [Mycobacterium tuberculosis]
MPAAFLLLSKIVVPKIESKSQPIFMRTGQPGENFQLNRADTIGMILRAVNQSGLNLRSLIDDVSSQVHGLRDAATEIAQGNQDLHGRTDATAAQLQQTAASMTQMTSTVRANTQTAQDANAYANWPAW